MSVGLGPEIGQVARAVGTAANIARGYSAVEETTKDEGVVYKRVSSQTGQKYVGQAKSMGLYRARQMEYNRNLGESHEYKVLDKNVPKNKLDFIEESRIRKLGGIQKEGGALANKRHQMNLEIFKQAVGDNKSIIEIILDML